MLQSLVDVGRASSEVFGMISGWTPPGLGLQVLQEDGTEAVMHKAVVALSAGAPAVFACSLCGRSCQERKMLCALSKFKQRAQK